MGASALIKVFRTLVAESLKRQEADAAKGSEPFPKADSDAIRGVMSQINKALTERIETRNQIVHAKWFIGFGDAGTDDIKSTGYYKRKLTQSGLDFVDGPKTAEDVDAMKEACDELAGFVEHFIYGFLTSDGPRGMSLRFVLKDKRWQIKQQ